MASMEGKVIAITGGASGIGLATAKILASRGTKLSIADVSEPNLEKAKTTIKEAAPKFEDILTYKCDVRSIDQVKDWIKQTVDKFGKLDGAANLAGTIGKNFSGFPLEDEDEENWELIIGVNLTVRVFPSQPPQPSQHGRLTCTGRHALHESRTQSHEPRRQHRERCLRLRPTRRTSGWHRLYF